MDKLRIYNKKHAESSLYIMTVFKQISDNELKIVIF